MKRLMTVMAVSVVVAWALAALWEWPDLSKALKCAMDPCTFGCPPRPRCGD